MDPPGSSTHGANEAAKKTAIIKELHQLEIKSQSMNKERELCLYRKTDRKEYTVLQDQEKAMLSEFKADRVKLKKDLSRLKVMVSGFHSELRDVNPSPKFLEKIKVVMEEVEIAITQFKELQRNTFEELMVADRLLSQELPALEKRFDGWLLQQAARDDIGAQKEGAVRAPLPSARDVTKDLPPEVGALEQFLRQTGGNQGGWDDYDHNTFLKFRTRHKGKPAFIAELAALLLTKTEEQIRQHEDWFQELMSLTEQKKRAIQQWRAKKEAEKEEALAQLSGDSSDEEAEQKKELAALQKASEAERQERVQRLSAWKVQKELQKTEEEERRLRADLDKTKKEQVEKAKQQEEKKQLLEMYRRQKQEDEEALLLAEEAQRKREDEEKRERLSKDIGRILLRNEQLVLGKLEKLKAKEREEREKEARLEKLKGQVEVHVERDPRRLLKPTAAWQERGKNAGPSDTAGRVYAVQHRAVPSWRQGL